MSDFLYTSVNKWGTKMRVRAVDSSGKRVQFEEVYYPKLYLSSASGEMHNCDMTTLDGVQVKEIRPGTMKDCKLFFEQYENVDGFDIYGNENYVVQWISDMYEGETIKSDIDRVRVGYIDIETECEAGFPDVNNPSEKINAITLIYNNKAHVMGVGKFEIDDPDVLCYEFANEIDMLESFYDLWNHIDLDLISSWNGDFFDIPYIINRTARILGDKAVNRLSPWKQIREKNANYYGQPQRVYEIQGVAQLDYQRLYRKYILTPRESYSLDHIAEVELGKKKLDWKSKYNSMSEFYTKDFQMFMEYNFIDTKIVMELEKKLKLIELHVALAYMAKVNYEDAFSQVRMWDALIYNNLREKGIVIPPKRINTKNSAYEGAYVKEPLVGVHDWVVSFDIASLYPSLIRMFSLGPETLVTRDTLIRRLNSSDSK